VYTDLFLDWSGELDGSWAACVNYMDGHLPYEPSAEHDQWGGETLRDLQSEMKDQVWEFNGGDRPWWQRRALEGLYDGTIHQMDSEIDRLVSALEDRGDLKDTLVVVTSDHGEGFGEPSRVRPGARVTAHGAGIHECLLHVPLIVKYPGQDHKETVGEPTSLTRFPDVVRSVVDDEWEIGTEFVPEDPVYASSHGLEEPMEERALKYVDDLWRFNGDALAIYEEGSEGLRKQLSWRWEYGAEIESVRATESYVSDKEFDPTPVNESFDALPDAGVKEDSGEEIAESTQKQLEDLGYM
jgi:arylsulfatase